MISSPFDQPPRHRSNRNRTGNTESHEYREVDLAILKDRIRQAEAQASGTDRLVFADLDIAPEQRAQATAQILSVLQQGALEQQAPAVSRARTGPRL